MFALVDCNSMYASCERIFRPDLRNRPVAVLSNNDGAVVTMTPEAKAIGLKKFEPYFKQKTLCLKHRIEVFSSNYELYGDISSKVMNLLETEAPDISIYSIDEAFLDFRQCHQILDLRNKGQQIKSRLWKEVRMPVCVGFGANKTLAKLANHIAKKHPKANGVCCLDESNQVDRWLARISVEDVWGIGNKISKRLNTLGIRTARELAKANKKYLRKHFNVNVERTARELCGEVCFEFHESIADKKQIIVSRMFGHKITNQYELGESLANYACRAAGKLRKQNGSVKTIIVSAQSSYYQNDYFRSQKVIELPYPTSDSRQILNSIHEALPTLFKEGVRYARAMVAFVELIDDRYKQFDLLQNDQAEQRNKNLMNVVDQLNRFNKCQISFGRQGIQRHWSMRRDLKSPNYTTNWKDIPKVNI